MNLVIKVDNFDVKFKSSSKEDCLKVKVDDFNFQQTADGSVKYLIKEAILSQLHYDLGHPISSTPSEPLSPVKQVKNT